MQRSTLCHPMGATANGRRRGWTRAQSVSCAPPDASEQSDPLSPVAAAPAPAPGAPCGRGGPETATPALNGR
eukprot:1721710-Pyramimonas_sp.AAC.1